MVKIKSMCRKPVADGWCVPLYIYIAFAVLGIVGILSTAGTSTQSKLTSAGLSLLWSLFIAYAMYSLCECGNEKWSWFILLLPLIIALFLIVIFFGAAAMGMDVKVNV